MSQENFKQGFRELVCMRIRVFSCSLLSRGTRFVVGFNLYFPCINMTVRELFCIRIWVFSCPLVSRGVSSLVLFYFSPYQRDVSGICLHKNLGVSLFLWRHLAHVVSSVVSFCFGKLFFFPYLLA